MVARWYREGVVYRLDVRTSQDSNDHGIGDFPELISRMDHLSRLGDTALWLDPGGAVLPTGPDGAVGEHLQPHDERHWRLGGTA